MATCVVCGKDGVFSSSMKRRKPPGQRTCQSCVQSSGTGEQTQGPKGPTRDAETLAMLEDLMRTEGVRAPIGSKAAKKKEVTIESSRQPIVTKQESTPNKITPQQKSASESTTNNNTNDNNSVEWSHVSRKPKAKSESGSKSGSSSSSSKGKKGGASTSSSSSSSSSDAAVAASSSSTPSSAAASSCSAAASASSCSSSSSSTDEDEMLAEFSADRKEKEEPVVHVHVPSSSPSSDPSSTPSTYTSSSSTAPTKALAGSPSKATAKKYVPPPIPKCFMCGQRHDLGQCGSRQKVRDDLSAIKE